MSGFAPTPDWSSAVAALRSAESVLLIAHVTPDPDALGSALALGLGLEALGKRVQVSVGEPGFTVPPSLSYLPGQHLVVGPEKVSLSDVVVICDTASRERLGVLSDAVEAASMSVVIDHHASFNGFGTVHVIDADAPATATLVLRILDLLDVELTHDIAGAIYAGIACDTGSFKYQATSSDTLRTAARLFDVGIDHADLARQIFDDEPFAALKVLGTALTNAVLDTQAVGGRGLVYTSISAEQRGILPELALERVIESMRRASEAEVAAVFKQTDDGVWKCSLRSKTTVDVGAIATAHNGGGHKYAAGYTGGEDLDVMVTELKRSLEQL
jgi:phosphoesterase RecJ-like protein